MGSSASILDELDVTIVTADESNALTYEAGQTVVDIVGGQSVGALAWIDDNDYASPFELRATRSFCLRHPWPTTPQLKFDVHVAFSTSVEIYTIPLSLIRENKELQKAMWRVAGQTIAFDTLTHQRSVCLHIF